MILSAILICNEMLRLLYYFSFSAKLSLVLNIIANASIDIILFMMMFIIVRYFG